MKRWLKPTGIAVMLFVATFLWIRCAEADTLFEVSPASFYGGEYAKNTFAVVGSERFSGKYDIGVVLASDGYGGNRAFQVTRIVRKSNFEMGIGFTWWAKPQPEAWSTDKTFNLHLGYEWGKWGIRWRHWSTAGTSDSNSGWDMLTIGYRFK
jgi:hypothetical protein